MLHAQKFWLLLIIGFGIVALADARLPYTATPVDYHIRLTVDPNKNEFEGETRIRIRLHEKLQSLRLHALDLTVVKVLTDKPGVLAQWKQNQPSPNEGEGRLIFSRPVDPKTTDFITLTFFYRARYNAHVTGLYRVREKGKNYVYSQMEPYSARRVFPSFDEPRFKTPFDVVIETPDGQTAIANAPLKNMTVDSRTKKRIWTFETTELLPTYLTAFMVGPFDIAEDAQNHLRVITTENKASLTSEALKITPPILQALERYTAIPYPYRKLDLLAVPDFEAGAMENPGAITFRDYYLVMDSKHATHDQKTRLAEVMAHELAHQWFGNLVTPRWWNDLWLNESFATWFGTKTLHALYPAYHEDIHALSRVQQAMNADALPTSRRIREPINSYQEIHNAFAAITYAKGGAILSMFEAWAGEERFQKANQQYLKAHAHNNAEASDWIQAVAKQAGKDVVPAFDSFLNQRGVPELEVQLECGKQPTVRVKQHAHTPLGIEPNPKALWQIPICLVYNAIGKKNGRADQCEMVRSQEEIFTLSNTKQCPKWLMPNKNGAGYFRFSMSQEWLKNLFNMGWAALSPRERLSALDSLIAGLSTGSVDVETFKRLTQGLNLGSERELISLWVHETDWMMDHVGLAREWVTQKIIQTEKTVAMRHQRTHDANDGEMLNDLRRILVFPLKHAALIKARAPFAKALLDDLADGHFDVPAHRAMAVDDVHINILAAMQALPDETAAGIEKAMKQLDDGLLRQTLLKALGTYPKEGGMGAILTWSLSANLRVNEQPILLEVASQHPTHLQETWTWLRANYASYSTKFSPMDLGELPWAFTAICDENFSKELKSFFQPKQSTVPGLQKHLEGALNDIQRCTAKKKYLKSSILPSKQ